MNSGAIGLVLSGGGAKGAFQAGVWKAMHELGLADLVLAIAGTSVGAHGVAADESGGSAHGALVWRKGRLGARGPLGARGAADESAARRT